MMTAQPETTLTAADNELHVRACERIDYSLHIVDGAFATGNTELADRYRAWGRRLLVVDETSTCSPRRE